jgi:Flp pilus assembly protein protease CpaA
MLSFVLLAIGICGFGLAGYLDLRYTEFPDWLPYSMIALTLAARTVFSFLWNDWSFIMNSLFFGAIFLGLGLLLYFAKQWGDGDAWLLGALGFMFPDQLEFGAGTLLPFPVTLIFNFLMISLMYLIAYSIFLGIKNSNVNRKYLEYLCKEKYKFTGVVIFFFGFSWCFAALMYFMAFSVANIMQMVALPFLLTFILLFSYYAKIVEKNLFKRRVKASELKVGDVVFDGRWKGLSKKEIKEIGKKSRYVWVKEGVRFAPVFLITMIISIFYGDLIFILV